MMANESQTTTIDRLVPELPDTWFYNSIEHAVGTKGDGKWHVFIRTKNRIVSDIEHHGVGKTIYAACADAINQIGHAVD